MWRFLNLIARTIATWLTVSKQVQSKKTFFLRSLAQCATINCAAKIQGMNPVYERGNWTAQLFFPRGNTELWPLPQKILTEVTCWFLKKVSHMYVHWHSHFESPFACSTLLLSWKKRHRTKKEKVPKCQRHSLQFGQALSPLHFFKKSSFRVVWYVSKIARNALQLYFKTKISLWWFYWLNLVFSAGVFLCYHNGGDSTVKLCILGCVVSGQPSDDWIRRNWSTHLAPRWII